MATDPQSPLLLPRAAPSVSPSAITHATPPGAPGGLEGYAGQPGTAASGALDARLLRPGTLLGGKYRLVRAAGFGGMGAVWVAKNESTGAEVAVKLLLADRAASSEANTRFRREAHAAAQLHHRGIVRVFDLVELTGDDAGALVMVMELLRGQTLADHLDRRIKLPVGEAVDLMLPMLSALAHAHALGVVHRDLKPDNIFLATDPDGHVTPKILDFGISKMMNASASGGAPRITGDGATLGTPGYMSPEQARGARDLDARSDVFTAAIVFYELLAGANPFASETYHSVVAAILERTPPPLREVPDALRLVIERALEKDPAARYADGAELAAAVRAALPTRSPVTSTSAYSYEAREAAPEATVTTTSFPPPVRVSRSERDVTSDVSGSSSSAGRARLRLRRSSRTLWLGMGAIAAGSLAFFIATKGHSTKATEPYGRAPSGATRPSAIVIERATSLPTLPSAQPLAHVPAEGEAESDEVAPVSDHAAATPTSSPAAKAARQAAPSASSTSAARASAPSPQAPSPAAPRSDPRPDPRAGRREPPIQRDPGF